MVKARFHTLGCKLNQAESVQMAALLHAEGIASDTADAGGSEEVVVVNTCAVTEKAAAKSRHTISRLHRNHPDALIIAAGCLAQLEHASLADIDGVGYVIGTSARFRTNWWVGRPDSTVVDVETCPSDSSNSTIQQTLTRSRPQLKIQDGCEQNCTYCVIPRLRGRPRSVPKDEILKAAHQLVHLGAREIVLTGVRLCSWGGDLEEPGTFVDLLRELTNIENLSRIRLGSIEPWELDSDLLELIITHEKICPHLHIPLQHTDSEILQRMGRPPVKETMRILHEIQSSHKDLNVGVDLIVGFPGESKEQFTRLLNDISDLPLGYIHAFSFSPRPGTSAMEYPDQIPAYEKKRRMSLLTETAQIKQRCFLETQLNKTLTVIPDRRRDGRKWVQAVTENYLRIQIPADRCTPGIPLRVSINKNSDGVVVGLPI